MGLPIKLSPQQSAETTAQSGHNNLREFSVLRKSTELIDGRLQTAEASITVQAGEIASKVSQTDYNGNTIASLINQTATTIDIEASKINLNGAVTANNYFKINLDGSMEATNGVFTGTITSTFGTIGGWYITPTSLQTGNYNTIGTRYFGSSGLSIGTGFRVDPNGFIVASGATITGTIHAGSGTIGGVSFSSGSGSNMIFSGALTASGIITGGTFSIGSATGITWVNTSNRVISSQSDLLNYGNLIVNQGGVFYRLKISGTSVVAENVDAYV